MDRPYRVWLYPIPNLIALAGWFFIFVTSGTTPILLGLGMLALGIVVFSLWSMASGHWPFARRAPNRPDPPPG